MMKAIFSVPSPLMALCLASVLPVQAEWKPAPSPMMTPWGKRVSPQNAWRQYPRPQLQRAEWTNLNGLWRYAVTAENAAAPTEWAGEILVPFAPEAALSGVGRLIDPKEDLWYERDLPAPTGNGRTILHFEAVDYHAEVFVNGKAVGAHTGGHTPFSFDITSALKPEGNILRVRVHDETEGYQLKGKQSLNPGGIWYTRVSGIWQTVWLEQIPQRAIEELAYAPDIRTGEVTVNAKLSGAKLAGETLQLRASLGGKEIATASGDAAGAVKLRLPEAKLWTPDTPVLYEITAELRKGDGEVVDAVKSYTALREVGRAKDAEGHWRITLNGKSIFNWGPLDQGWWPDGLLTPPSEEAMLSDVEYLKAAGFNMIRKHIKVEPRRFYYDCDRLGMMVWQDQVNEGQGLENSIGKSAPRWTRMEPNPQDGEWPADQQKQFILEYQRMVDHLRQHPSIVMWEPFNEAWGQHNTMEIGKMAVEYDPTRLVNIASGGNFWPVGHVADHHEYPDPNFPLDDPRFDSYIKVVGEFGGHGLVLDGHQWDSKRENWGYGSLPKDLNEWKRRFSRSIDHLRLLRKRGIAAGVYTQTSDVEIEINGLLTYDRVPKIDAAWVRAESERLLATPDLADHVTLVPDSAEAGHKWHYTTTRPGDNWASPDFDAQAWSVGEAGFGTRDTPRTQVRTVWNSDDIWIRRSFKVESKPRGQYILRIYHDEDAEVYIDGKEVIRLEKHNGRYQEILLPDLGLEPGEHTIAIHCRQTHGGQYIDAGLSVH